MSENGRPQFQIVDSPYNSLYNLQRESENVPKNETTYGPVAEVVRGLFSIFLIAIFSEVKFMSYSCWEKYKNMSQSLRKHENNFVKKC